MHEFQSWEIRVVCPIWVQKCVDLAHSISLELESLESSSFTMLHLQNGRVNHPLLGQFCHPWRQGKRICLAQQLFQLHH